MPETESRVAGIENIRPIETMVEVEEITLRKDVLQAYLEQAADTERENEALIWSEALIGDGFEAR